MSTHSRKRLLEILVKKSYLYRPDEPFKLASGRLSPYYVDCKPTTNSAEGLRLIGEIFLELVGDLHVTAIGGLTMGADPLAHATALLSFERGRPINSFSVRKAAKDHGHAASKLVVGDVKPGDRVVIVDDVITTGGSTVQAIEESRRFGLDVVKVIVLVDREEGGKAAIEGMGVDVQSVFTLSQLKGYAGNDSVDSDGPSWREPARACSGM